MCSRCTACPFTSAVFSETHEGSGSKPGGCFKPGLSTDFEGLIGKPSGSSRLYSEVEGTLGTGRCCLCSCPEGCLQLLICPPCIPTPGCPSGPRSCSVLASCVSIGLCFRVASWPSPAEALRLGPWQLEVTSASRKAFLESTGDLADLHFLV